MSKKVRSGPHYLSMAHTEPGVRRELEVTEDGRAQEVNFQLTVERYGTDVGLSREVMGLDFEDLGRLITELSALYDRMNLERGKQADWEAQQQLATE